jgi:hypothetical protein
MMGTVVPSAPPLTGNVDPSKIEEIRRTVYVGNLNSSVRERGKEGGREKGKEKGMEGGREKEGGREGERGGRGGRKGLQGGIWRLRDKM